VISAKGIASTPQYLRYLFDAAQKYGTTVHDVPERDSAVEREPVSSLTSKEVLHA